VLFYDSNFILSIRKRRSGIRHRMSDIGRRQLVKVSLRLRRSWPQLVKS